MPKLICVEGANLGDEWDVRIGTTTIGRKAGNHVVLHDPKVSRQHAILKFEDDQFAVEDLNSLNGTHIYEKRIIHSSVVPETQIKFGNTTLLLTKKSLRGVAGHRHIESVGEDLLYKQKSKQVVMSEILHEIVEIKEKNLDPKKEKLEKLLKLPKPPPKKKGLSME